MRKKILCIWLLVMGFLGSGLLAACQSQTPTPNLTPSPTSAFGTVVTLPYGKYIDISVAELQTMTKNKDFILINIQTPYAGNLPGTDIALPYDSIDKNLDKLPGGKTAKLVLYGLDARESGIASATMVKLGYTAIYNLVGGMDAWQKDGYNLVK